MKTAVSASASAGTCGSTSVQLAFRSASYFAISFCVAGSKVGGGGGGGRAALGADRAGGAVPRWHTLLAGSQSQ